MRRNVFGTAKNIDHVHIAGNRRYGAIYFFAKHFCSIGIKNWHGDDVVARTLCVLRYEEGRPMVAFLDAQHGDALRVGDHPPYAVRRIDEMVPPVFGACFNF